MAKKKETNKSSMIAAGVGAYLLWNIFGGNKAKSREQLIDEIIMTCSEIPGCMVDKQVLEQMPRENLIRILDELKKKKSEV